jgi:hypothetical protein
MLPRRELTSIGQPELGHYLPTLDQSAALDYGCNFDRFLNSRESPRTEVAALRKEAL